MKPLRRHLLPVPVQPPTDVRAGAHRSNGLPLAGVSSARSATPGVTDHAITSVTGYGWTAEPTPTGSTRC